MRIKSVYKDHDCATIPEIKIFGRRGTITGKQKYADIINLPHHVSKVHPSMPIKKRAAQFAPFAALTGYEDAIMETEQINTMEMELGKDVKREADEGSI